MVGPFKQLSSHMVVLVQYVFLAFESVNEIVWCTIQMKPLQQYIFT